MRSRERARAPKSSTGQAHLVQGLRHCGVVRRRSSRGFSILEILLAIGITMVLLAIALPSVFTANRTFKLVGSARTLGHQLALTRMRAANQFTRARLTVDVAAGTYQIEVCTAKGVSGCTTYTPEGGTQYFASSISFGFGALTVPAGTQTSIAQTSPIVFNSRGIPVDDSGSPTGNDALYLTNGAGEFYAVSVSASGKVTIWRYTGTAWVVA